MGKLVICQYVSKFQFMPLLCPIARNDTFNEQIYSLEYKRTFVSFGQCNFEMSACVTKRRAVTGCLIETLSFSAVSCADKPFKVAINY